MIVRPGYGAVFQESMNLIITPSYWTHTFKIEGIGEIDFDPDIRPRLDLTTFCEFDFEEQPELTIMLETCQTLLPAVDRFQKQKIRILSSIKAKVIGINHFFENDENDRHTDRTKRAPLGIIGFISNRLFGLAQDKSVKRLKHQLDFLARETNASLHQVFTKVDLLESGMINLDKRVAAASKVIRNQQSAIDLIEENLLNLSSALSQTFTDINDQLANIYNLIRLQTALFSNILKHSVGQLNALQIIESALHRQLTALSTLAQGYLPIELVSPKHLTKVLDTIAQKLMHEHPLFRLGITDINYFYQTKVVGFYQGSNVGISMKIPLTSHSNTFTLHQVQALKVPVDPVDFADKRSLQIQNLSPYFAVSVDGLYFIDMTLHDLNQCDAPFHDFRVCPVMAYRDQSHSPSCTAAVFSDQPSDVKQQCKISYFPYANTPPQIIHITSRTFVMSIPNETITVTCPLKTSILTPCKLCLQTLQCECSIRSPSLFIPSMLVDCFEDIDQPTKTLFPINMLALTELYEQEVWGLNNGSTWSTTIKKVHFPDIDIPKSNEEILDTSELELDFEQIIDLSKSKKPMYLSRADYLFQPKTWLQKFTQSKFSTLITGLIILVNIASMALIAYFLFKRYGLAGAAAALAKRIEAKSVNDYVLIGPTPSSTSPSPKTLSPDTFSTIDLVLIIAALYVSIKILSCLVKWLYNYVHYRFQFTAKYELPPVVRPGNLFMSITNTTDEVPLLVMPLHVNSPSSLSFSKDTKAVVKKLKVSCFLKPMLVINWHDSKILQNDTNLNLTLKSQICVPWAYYFRVSNIISGHHSFDLLFTQNGLTRPLTRKTVYPVLSDQP